MYRSGRLAVAGDIAVRCEPNRGSDTTNPRAAVDHYCDTQSTTHGSAVRRLGSARRGSRRATSVHANQKAAVNAVRRIALAHQTRQSCSLTGVTVESARLQRRQSVHTHGIISGDEAGMETGSGPSSARHHRNEAPAWSTNDSSSRMYFNTVSALLWRVTSMILSILAWCTAALVTNPARSECPEYSCGLRPILRAWRFTIRATSPGSSGRPDATPPRISV